MKLPLDGAKPSRMQRITVCVTALVFSVIHITTLSAQNPLPKVFYPQNSDTTPGAIGGARLLRGGPVVGYYQPVEVSGPEKIQIALAQDSRFLEPLTAPVKVGMLVGSVYRLRVTNIPNRPGEELYPTIEVLDRMYAPRGREHRFPVPIVLEQDDLINALNGALIQRVVYLEDNEVASPISDEPGTQRVLDVAGSENALQVADGLGRPMAILRIGSRVPSDLQSDLTGFLYGCPPWMPLLPVPNKTAMEQAGVIPQSDIPAPGQNLRHEPQPNVPRVPAEYGIPSQYAVPR